MLSDIVKALVDAGATPKVIAAAVEAIEAKQEERRAKERDRKRAYRSRNVPWTNGDRTGQDGTQRDQDVVGLAEARPQDVGPPRARVEGSSSRLEISVGTVDDSACAISDAEEQELREAAGTSIDPTSPSLFSMAEVMAWKRAGWHWDLDIIPGVRAAAARAKNVRHWKYFRQAVADRHAQRTAPMPVGEARRPNGQAPPKSRAAIALERRRNRQQTHEPDYDHEIELQATRFGGR